MIPNIQNYINLAKLRIYSYLLPDTCTIYPTTRTADDAGGYSEAPGSNRTYNNSTNIPCRFDRSTQYKDSDIFTQETTITTYTVFLPGDCDIETDDTIVHNSIKYAIKQLTDDHSFRSLKIVYAVAVL